MPGRNTGSKSGASYDYLDERFREIAKLGSLEKAATCLAQDNVTGEIFVKKYITEEHAAIYERLKEARHKSLVRIYYVAKKGAKALVIMEYVSGRTLERLFQEGASFSEEDAASCLHQLLDGLLEIHKSEIVHRDISPKNLLISTDGILKILDFDIGRLYKKGQGVDTEILGTAGYAAPEQFGFAQSDKRSDIFAAGVVANRMLTGAMPQERLYTEGRIGKVISTCIQMDPKMRYQNAAEALLELNASEIPVNAVIAAAPDFSEKKEEPEKKSVWPGFRSGKKWKKVLAMAYYLLMGIYSVASVAECARTFQAGMLETIAVILYIWLSVFLSLDFLQWMEKTPGIRRLTGNRKKAFGIFLWLFLFCAGFKLEEYVRIDLLHIAVKNK